MVNALRVFTSLLWTLVGSVAYRLLSDNFELGLFIFLFLLTVLAICRLTIFVDANLNSKRVFSTSTVIVLSAMTISPGYTEWSILSLMDAGVWNALIIFAFIELASLQDENLLPGSNRRLAVLLFLMVFTRPESMLWGPILVFLRAVQVYRLKHTTLTSVFAYSAGPTAAFCASLVSLIGFRLYYFGFPLPNTYYAKVSADRFANLLSGFEYLWTYVYEVNPFSPALLVLALLAGLMPNHGFPKMVGTIWIGVAFVLTTIATPLLTGGDHFALARFMQVSEPLLWALLALSWAKSSTMLSKRREGKGRKLNKVMRDRRAKVDLSAMASGLLVVVAVGFCVFRVNNAGFLLRDKEFVGMRHEFVLPVVCRQNMTKLNRFFSDLPGYPSCGVFTAGGNSYAYAGRTIDLLGLNNIEMAHANKVKNKNALKNHASFDVDVFFHQQPDLFWLDANWFPRGTQPNRRLVSPDPIRRAAFEPIWSDERFLMEYQPVLIRKKDFDECLAVFARRNFLGSLEARTYTIQTIDRE